MRIGIFGGTFDPVHNGHLALGRAALNQLRLDRVYFVLSPRSPFKIHQKKTPLSVRLQMLRAALRGQTRLAVGLWELKRRGPSYAILTLKSLARRRPGDERYLIVGSDALRDFKRWRNPRGILKLATLVTGQRPGAKTFPKKILGRDVIVLKGAFPDISSSGIRKRYHNSLSVRMTVPALARRIIDRQRLYEN